MNINEYKDLAMRTNDGKAGKRVFDRLMEQDADYLGFLPDPGELLNGALGLTGEAGEVADQIKKYIFHGHDLNRDDLIKEIGDVCWYVALLCDALEVDLEEVMRRNIDKLRNRYPEGFSEAASVNRKE